MGAKIIVVLFLILAMGVGLFVVRSGVVGKLASGVSGLAHFRSASGTPAVGTPAAGAPAASAEPATPKSGTKYYNTGSKFKAPPPVPQPPAPASPQPPAAPLPPPPEAVPPYDIPEGFTAKDLSPYFHKIRIGSVSAGSAYYMGQVSLYANFYPPAGSGAGGGAINVSGWNFQARDGSQLVPQAVDIYDPSGLAAESDIYLRSGDVLNIYSGASAIARNLHLNKCLGFLENTNGFTPSIPRYCPGIDRREIRGFDGQCQDYIMSLGSCQLPSANPPVPDNDDDCRAYLNTINYKSCFDRRRFDADFLSREWWAWSGSRFLDQRHDRIRLLDRKGLLVDLYEY